MKSSTWSDSEEKIPTKKGEKNCAFVTSVFLDAYGFDSNVSSDDEFVDRRQINDKFVQLYKASKGMINKINALENRVLKMQSHMEKSDKALMQSQKHWEQEREVFNKEISELKEKLATTEILSVNQCGHGDLLTELEGKSQLVLKLTFEVDHL